MSWFFVGFCSLRLLVVGGLAFLVFRVHPFFLVFCTWYPLDGTESQLKAGETVCQTLIGHKRLFFTLYSLSDSVSLTQTIFMPEAASRHSLPAVNETSYGTRWMGAIISVLFLVLIGIQVVTAVPKLFGKRTVLVPEGA